MFMSCLMLLKFSMSRWFAQGYIFPLSANCFAISANWFFRHNSLCGAFSKCFAKFSWGLLNKPLTLFKSNHPIIFKRKKKTTKKRLLISQLMYSDSFKQKLCTFMMTVWIHPSNYSIWKKQVIYHRIFLSSIKKNIPRDLSQFSSKFLIFSKIHFNSCDSVLFIVLFLSIIYMFYYIRERIWFICCLLNSRNHELF